MASNLTRTQTPEERELAAKRADLAALEIELTQRELDLATLQMELRAFEQRYVRIVGVKFAQIDDLEAQVAEALNRQNPFDETAHRRAAEARRNAEESARVVGAIEPATQAFEKPSEDLKRLYREIAKRIHPDLATNDADRAKRNQVMAEVNRAYLDGNESRLRSTLDEWETSPESVTGDGVGAELVRTIRKIHQVEARLARIEADFSALTGSELCLLKARVDSEWLNGRDLLMDMAAQLDTQILHLRRKTGEFTREASA